MKPAREESTPPYISPAEPQIALDSSWPDAEWFLANKSALPKEPFRIDCALMVEDAPRYFDYLESEISLGKSNPRYRNGVIQDDLKRLRKIFF